MRTDTTHLIAVVLSGLLIATVVTGGILVGPAVGQDDAAVGFEGDTYRETAIGDPIRTPYHIILTDTENATIVFTGARNTETPFWANVTLRDDDGDGHIFLHINMWEIGHSNPFRAESGSVTRFDQDELAEERLLNKTKSTDQSAYELYLGAGTDPASVLASHSATGRLRIEEAETEDMNVMTAPRGATVETAGYVFTEADAFASVYPNMSIRDDAFVAAGNTIVYAPFGGGYYGVAQHALKETGSREGAFEWILENGYLEFDVEGVSGNDKVLNISHAIDIGALQFDSGLYYYHLIIAVDTTEPIFQRNGEGEFVTARAGETYEASITKTGRVDPSGDVAFLRTKTFNMSIVEPSAEFDAPVNTLRDGVIRGRTTLAPGSTVTVYIDTGEEVTTRSTTVVQDWTLEQYESGALLHPFNFSLDIGDADPTDVRVEAWNEDAGRLGSYPPDEHIRNATDGSDDGDGSNGDGSTTTAPSDDGTTTPGDGDGGDGTTTAPASNGDDGGADGGDGDGGLIPGFGLMTGLLAALASILLIGLRRR